jgi:hypothetical protein
MSSGPSSTVELVVNAGSRLLPCRLALALGLLLASCHGEQPAATSSAPALGAPLEFGFSAPGGEIVDSTNTRGRATVIVFITTFDVPSQIASGVLAHVIREFTPRSNALAVVLEDPQFEALLPTYRETLNLPFPVAMADFATQNGQSAFGAVTVIPTFVVLDRQGRQTWRRNGPATRRELAEALDRASGSSAR